MAEYELQLYELADGTCPVATFLSKLDPKMRAKVLWTMNLLEEHGPDLRGPYSKHLTDGIFELRVKFGSDITRTLYFFHFGKKIILTNGFVKKEQKTPKQQIKLAMEYRQDFMERKGGLGDG